jgi:NAD(P)-dependent dehydrogenase (short-subunit alcohol dehydrogenase family)
LTEKTQMKNILIIGGATGIGAALTKMISEKGDRVYATYHQAKPLFSAPDISYHQLDVRDTNADNSFLPDVLHGFVYCPGSISLKSFPRIKPEDFMRDYELNVVGAIRLLQEALPGLKAAEQSSVIFFSTVAVQLGLNFHSQVSASKGALEGLTRALAAEFAPKIRVNCIAPSLTDTPLAAGLLSSPEKRESNALRHPLRRVGSADDIANMAEFLLSERSGWISGQVLHVDGGMSILRV